MLFATAAFFLVSRLGPADNRFLWAAFLAYLALRGLMQALLYSRITRRTFPVGRVT